eukprot:Gb_31273 [translate_table: standard]
MSSESWTANVGRRFFKWPWTMHSGEASASAGLLSGVPPEIELSDYQRLPAGDAESPSDLLKGERLKVGPIPDLDRFFERLYNYYCEKGLWCIVTQWIVELLSLGFTICFSGFFLLFVDWHGLRTAKCGLDAVESGSKPCDLAKEALYRHPLRPFTFFRGIVVVYLGIFSLYWIFCFLRFFAQLKDTLEIRDFYQNSLNITDREVQTLSWPAVLDKTVQFQSLQRLCVVKDLSAHDVVMRIMRKDNFLIGMLNKGVLALPIPRWVPGAGPVVHCEANGTKNRLMLTKALEWSLNWCILQNMFDRNFSIRRDFINNSALLRKRLMAVGFGMLILSPFLIIFTLVYFFLRHAEQFYNHPSTAASRRWSNLSRWIFREFNELDHLFKHRLNASVKHAVDYVRQFPSPIVSLIAKFISFVAGGFAAILIIIAFLDESLLEAHLFGRNLLWYAAIFGTVTAISRAAITDEFQVFDPEGAMSLVAQHTHYMPKSWRGAENSDYVRTEFEALFQYTGMMLLEEMVSIFVTPYVLFFILPKRVDDMSQFIVDFTVSVEGVGDVCSLSVFDFEHHGNSKYGSPFNTSKDRRSCQGKMEKSFLSFKSSYPSWEPNAQGKQFLSTLLDFRLQEQDREATQVYSSDRISQRLPALRGSSSGNSSGLREGLLHRWPVLRSHSADVQPGQLDPSWISEMEQKDHLYWLDRYYTFQSLHGSDVRDNRAGTSGLQHDLLPSEDPFCTSYNAGGQHPRGLGETFGFPMDDRLGSHMQASTSSTVFQENMIRQGNMGQVAHIGESHWWARTGPWAKTGPQSTRTHESFLEPPDFGGQHLERSLDDFSYGSEDDQDTGWAAMKQSQAHYKNTSTDEDATAFDLPFGDVYEQPVHTAQERMRPVSREGRKV